MELKVYKQIRILCAMNTNEFLVRTKTFDRIGSIIYEKYLIDNLIQNGFILEKKYSHYISNKGKQFLEKISRELKIKEGE